MLSLQRSRSVRVSLLEGADGTMTGLIFDPPDALHSTTRVQMVVGRAFSKWLSKDVEWLYSPRSLMAGKLLSTCSAAQELRVIYTEPISPRTGLQVGLIQLLKAAQNVELLDLRMQLQIRLFYDMGRNFSSHFLSWRRQPTRHLPLSILRLPMLRSLFLHGMYVNPHELALFLKQHGKTLRRANLQEIRSIAWSLGRADIPPPNQFTDMPQFMNRHETGHLIRLIRPDVPMLPVTILRAKKRRKRSCY